MSMPVGERRIVSVLVADVVGSTTIAETLGPERSKFLFDDIVRLMRDEVERLGGTIAQLTGDGVLALFGAPLAHEDDAERAVRAALAIRDALAAYSTQVGQAYQLELSARVAVNTGPVVVPAGDAPPHVLYNALGDTVNVAARLQTLGDLVVGPVTAHQVEATFELDELGAIELKGKREPVAAFRVVGIRAQTPVHVEAPFVGRRSELAALSGALDGLLEGRGAIVSVTGEPGIGKSRLVAAAEERFDGRIRFLAGHAVAYAETIPYWPVREQLRRWLGLGVSDPEARVRLELRTELARTLAGEAEAAYPFLATLLGLALAPEEEQPIHDLARDAVRQETFYWLYQLVCALARERPLCLVLEDLHWSDEATLAALDELIPAVERNPICFLIVHRSDPDHPAWQLIDRAGRRFRRSFLELELQPLPEADTRVIAAVDAGGDLSDALADLVATRTGGNPYFVGEAIRDLRERGALERRDGHVVLVGETTIPAALQGALQARLDRLDAGARELITTAAVIGRSFGVPLLERLLPRALLLSTLSELQWLQLVVEEQRGDEPEYRFRHGLVQEAAYQSLVESHRRELHRRVGEALHDLHRDSPAEVYGLLAHHFTEADEPEQAVEYLLKAGDAARAAYADDEAIELFERALAFMDRTGDEARTRQTLLRIALAHHIGFNYAAANDALRQAFARPDPTPRRMEPNEHVSWALGAGWRVDQLAPSGYADGNAADVTVNLFRGLVAVGRDGEVEPDLAERFTVSDDGCLYRFTLRANACWSDGVPVTAGDFTFTFARMVEDDMSSVWLDGVTARALDDRTLELELDEPRNHFLYLLGQQWFFPWPRHVCEHRGPDWAQDIPLVGSGPFVLTGRNAHADGLSGNMTMDAAPAWYGARGNVGRVTVEVESSPAEACDRWRAGGYDLFDQYLAIGGAITADDSTIVEQDTSSFTAYLGLVAARPPVDDARVRRAVAHAIDRHGLPPIDGITPTSTGGAIPPSMPGHSHRVAPPFDPDRARALLSDAGYPGGRGLAEITLAHMEHEEPWSASIAHLLEAVGVRVRLISCRTHPDMAAAIAGSAHAYVLGFGSDFPDPARGMLEPFLREATCLYRDTQLEQLLARATAARDQDEGLHACREFERVWIAEQAAIVPLAYTNHTVWRRPWLTGVWVSALSTSTFADASVTRPRDAR